MNEQEAISYIENYGWSTTRLGLSRTQELLRRLGDPQKHLKFIHVAGSNGKGSTCAMLDAILRKAGYRTGLYISPYIEVFNERIQINGENIPGQRLADLTERVMNIAETMEDHPSQFELVTAIALQYYYEEKCDIVVLEVGMGGALDSTNAIDAPEAAVITNIGLEHTEYLGRTLTEIARTKAGIIKPGCVCVCYDSEAEVTDVIKEVCAEKNVPLSLLDFSRLRVLSQSLKGQSFTWDEKTYELSLIGNHQLHNAALVLMVIEALRKRGWTIPSEAVYEGMKNTVWPARMEILNRDPLFILDGGHNPQCAEAMADSLKTFLPDQKVVFLAGVLADKDYDTILDILLPFADTFVCVTPASPRALSAENLKKHIEERGVNAVACNTIEEGIPKALCLAKPGQCIVAFGSLYLAGTVRSSFKKQYRKWIRADKIRARDTLTDEERSEKSRAVVQKILSDEWYQNAKTVLIYDHVRGEVSLDDLVNDESAQNKRIVYPLCISQTGMEAFWMKEECWKAGAFGIREPDPEKAIMIDPQEIDLVICPCTSFDENGSRMGMGAGYYDRYLPKCTSAHITAAAFETQKYHELPCDPWDQPMEKIFTEEAVYSGLRSEF